MLAENPTITSLTSSALSNKVILPRTGFDQSLSFECAVSRGSHPVTFQWSHNGGSVQGSFTSTRFSGNNFIGQLHISRLTPSHNGQYTCSTQNTVGHSSSRIFVTVVGMLVTWITILHIVLFWTLNGIFCWSLCTNHGIFVMLVAVAYTAAQHSTLSCYVVLMYVKQDSLIGNLLHVNLPSLYYLCINLQYSMLVFFWGHL